MSRTNVLIVGAGPVGLIAALGLARAGIGVEVLDVHAGPAADPHDMIFRWSTLPVLDDLDVLDDLRGAGVATSQWCYHVLYSGEQLVFDLDLLIDEVAHPYNLHLSHERFSAVLLRHLERHPNATVAWGTRVSTVTQDADGVSALADGPHGPRVYRGGWLIGADGAHSIVRRSLGMGFAGVTWPERLVSLRVDFDFTTVGYLPATYQLDPHHGALVAQVGDNGAWCYVYGESRTLPEPSVADRIPAALKAALPPGVDVQPLAWSASRVHERAADGLRAGRVLLGGDAGHVTNPTGSFGLAGGVFDAATLVDALVQVGNGAAPDTALDLYARDRDRVFRTVASPLSSDTMHLVFHTDHLGRLESEIESYRRIVTDPARQRDFLLLSRELKGLPAV